MSQLNSPTPTPWVQEQSETACLTWMAGSFAAPLFCLMNVGGRKHGGKLPAREHGCFVCFDIKRSCVWALGCKTLAGAYKAMVIYLMYGVDGLVW